MNQDQLCFLWFSLLCFGCQKSLQKGCPLSSGSDCTWSMPQLLAHTPDSAAQQAWMLSLGSLFVECETHIAAGSHQPPASFAVFALCDDQRSKTCMPLMRIKSIVCCSACPTDSQGSHCQCRCRCSLCFCLWNACVWPCNCVTQLWITCNRIRT